MIAFHRFILGCLLVVALVCPILPCRGQETLPASDLHCDALMTLWRHPEWNIETKQGQVSLAKLEEGGIALQVFAIFVPPGKGNNPNRVAEKELDAFFERVVSASHGRIRQARTHADVLDNLASGHVSAILSVEGAHVLGEDASALVPLAESGLRILALTWNNSNAFADGLGEEDPPPRCGLTAEGERLLRLMEVHRIVADVSHAHWETFWDIVTTIHGPVIASHSNARSICDHKRNLDDEQLVAIAEKHGIVGLVFHSGFVSRSGHASMKDLLRHYLHIARTIGRTHVALGSDFDGTKRPVDGLSDSSGLQGLASFLLGRGVSSLDISDLFLGNVLRMLGEAQDRYFEIAPLDWRPMRVSLLDDSPDTHSLFDRLSTTSVRVCFDADSRPPALFGFRALGDGLGALAVRIAAPCDNEESCGDGGQVSLSVQASRDAACGSAIPLQTGHCRTDGSRCLLPLPSASLAGMGRNPWVLVTVRPEVSGKPTCLEIQDLVPIRTINRELERQLRERGE